MTLDYTFIGSLAQDIGRLFSAQNQNKWSIANNLLTFNCDLVVSFYFLRLLYWIDFLVNLYTSIKTSLVFIKFSTKLASACQVRLLKGSYFSRPPPARPLRLKSSAWGKYFEQWWILWQKTGLIFKKWLKF